MCDIKPVDKKYRSVIDIRKVVCRIVNQLRIKLDTHLCTIDDMVSVGYIAYDKAKKTFEGDYAANKFDKYWIGIVRRDIIDYLRKISFIGWTVRNKYGVTSLDDVHVDEYSIWSVEAIVDLSLISSMIDDDSIVKSKYKPFIEDCLFGDLGTLEAANKHGIKQGVGWVVKCKTLKNLREKFNAISGS